MILLSLTLLSQATQTHKNPHPELRIAVDRLSECILNILEQSVEFDSNGRLGPIMNKLGDWVR
jgi:hypothetical protein